MTPGTGPSMPIQAMPPTPMYMPRAATISPPSRATYWCQPGRLTNACSQPPVSSRYTRWTNSAPLVLCVVAHPLDRELSRDRTRERLAAADNSVLLVERLQAALAKPSLVGLGPAVGEGL